MSTVLYNMDCLDVLGLFIENESVDSIVTDPPYGLGFMGKKWDHGVPGVEFWLAAYDALKPGGYLLAFGGSRTYHRMASAIEDAGFEIRDQIIWIYGTGFPKSRNGEWGGTALKPAHEPICVARKPLVGTVEANWRRYGTGALNIAACRIQTDEVLRAGSGAIPCRHNEETARGRAGQDSADARYSDQGGTNFAMTPGPRGGDALGRWPANLIHDGSDEVRAAFPDAKGQRGDLVNHEKTRQSPNGIFGGMRPALDHAARIEADLNAARFFYCAKATKKERNYGCEALPQKIGGMISNTSGQHMTRRDEGYVAKPQGNTHPTVKPVALIQYLQRLVTPPGGLTADIFMGSGTSGVAAQREGFSFIGAESDTENGYFAIAEARIAHEKAKVSA